MDEKKPAASTSSDRPFATVIALLYGLAAAVCLPLCMVLTGLAEHVLWPPLITMWVSAIVFVWAWFWSTAIGGEQEDRRNFRSLSWLLAVAGSVVAPTAFFFVAGWLEQAIAPTRLPVTWMMMAGSAGLALIAFLRLHSEAWRRIIAAWTMSPLLILIGLQRLASMPKMDGGPHTLFTVAGTFSAAPILTVLGIAFSKGLARGR